MTNKPLRAVILPSVSTPEQATDEKQSLDTQERELRAIAAARGWDVAYVLRIPGFSRDFISWEECEREMLKANPPIYAMRELRELTEKRAYDILMVRDPDRFGRTQTLVSQVAETVCIRYGLRIYSQMDNQLSEGDASRFWAAMVGLRVANDQDKRRKYRHDGMEERLKNDLPVSSVSNRFYKVVRTELGKAIKVELREDMKQLALDLATVVLGDADNPPTPWQSVEAELYRRYGYINPKTNLPFAARTFRRALLTPTTWGHSYLYAHKRTTKGEVERQRDRYTLPHDERQGAWAFDENVSPPAGVLVQRFAWEPVYTGELAQRIKTELYRRMNVIKGKAKPQDTREFTGLLICKRCGGKLKCNTKVRKNGVIWRAWVCAVHNQGEHSRLYKKECDQWRQIRDEVVRAFLEPRLQKVVQDSSAAAIIEPSSSGSLETRRETLLAEIRAAESYADGLMIQRAKGLQNLHARLDGLIQQADERLGILQNQLAQLEQEESRNLRFVDARAEAVNAIVEIGSGFWQETPTRINQLLHQIFGEYRLVIDDGEVSGVVNRNEL